MKIQPLFLATIMVALPLTAQPQPASAPSKTPDFVKKLEVGIFGGFSGYSLRNNKYSPSGAELDEGGLGGFRIGGTLTPRWSLEGAYAYGVNNLNLFPLLRNNGPLQSGFGSRNHSLSLNPVWHFADPDKKWRPYLTAGGGAMWFNLTDAATTRLLQLGSSSRSSRGEPSFNFGGGVKYGINKLTSLRLDARNVWAGNPHFGLPEATSIPGGYYIAPKGWQTGIQLTAGLGLSFGAVDSKPQLLTTSLTGDTSNVLIGQSRPFKFNVDAPAKAIVKNTWSLNGVPFEQSGDLYNFDSTGRAEGMYKICATASAKKLVSSTSCQELKALLPMRNFNSVGVTADPASVYAGTSSKITATADPASIPTINYAWTVNGAKQSETGSSFVFDTTGKAPGMYTICATASSAGYTEKQGCTTVEIKAYGNPSISMTASPAEVEVGKPAKVTVTTKPNAAGTPVNVALKSSEGSISPDGTFDSTGVTFDKSTPGIQRKTVTITGTATDANGGSATATTTVTVKSTPVAQRLDDIVFAAGSSRVNNCGKRLLLEVLTDKMKADPNAQVVLIGHLDKSEQAVVRKGSKRTVATNSDKRRALNVAAVLSAGTGICSALDLGRVKVGYAGTEETSAPMLDFCGTSTVIKGGKPDPRIGYRRVEVWLVPGGATMPSSTVSFIDPPADAVKALGCPK